MWCASGDTLLHGKWDAWLWYTRSNTTIFTYIYQPNDKATIFQANHLTHFCLLYGRASDNLWWCLTCVSRAYVYNTSTPDFNIYGLLMPNIMYTYKLDRTFCVYRENQMFTDALSPSAAVYIWSISRSISVRNRQAQTFSYETYCSALLSWEIQANWSHTHCLAVVTITTSCNILVKYYPHAFGIWFIQIDKWLWFE